MSVRYVFFDLDHTLWDFERNADETLAHLYELYGLKDLINGDVVAFSSLYHEINRRMWSEYDRGLITKDYLRNHRFEETLTKLGASPNDIPKDMWVQFLEICPQKTHLMEGAMEILEQLNQKYAMGIITNGFERTQQIKVKSSGISHFFRHVVTSEAFGMPKPKAEIFYEMMKRMNAAPNECVMIGDSEENDVVGALNAGITAIHYHPDTDAGSPRAHQTIRHLKELSGLL